MASRSNLLAVLLVIVLIACVDPAAAAGIGMGFGDGLALFLCFGILIVGVLACLGCYSRRLMAERY